MIVHGSLRLTARNSLPLRAAARHLRGNTVPLRIRLSLVRIHPAILRPSSPDLTARNALPLLRLSGHPLRRHSASLILRLSDCSLRLPLILTVHSPLHLAVRSTCGPLRRLTSLAIECPLRLSGHFPGLPLIRIRLAILTIYSLLSLIALWFRFRLLCHLIILLNFPLLHCLLFRGWLFDMANDKMLSVLPVCYSISHYLWLGKNK